MSINEHRLKREPLEKKYLDAWLTYNDNNQILKYILDPEHKNTGLYYVTDDYRKIADTMMQWLGSPVGQGFLEGVR